MRRKPWLLASLSLLFLACATASKPLLSVSLTLGGGSTKRALDLKGRAYTVTITQLGLDKKLKVETFSGTLEKEEHRRLIERFEAVDIAALKEFYAGRDLERMRRTATLRVSYKGVAKTIMVIGQPDPAVEPLLAPLLPLLDRIN